MNAISLIAHCQNNEAVQSNVYSLWIAEAPLASRNDNAAIRGLSIIILGICMMFAASSPATAAQQDEVKTICSELCHAKKSQAVIAEYVEQGLPEWAQIIPEAMQDYTQCAIGVIEKDGRTFFDDFDETDMLFDLASEQCRKERETFDAETSQTLVKQGVFASKEIAMAQIIPLRAMSFTGIISSEFDQEGGSFSPASRYFVSRLPLLYDITQDE